MQLELGRQDVNSANAMCPILSNHLDLHDVIIYTLCQVKNSKHSIYVMKFSQFSS
jgi:hypothetical protein